MKSRTSFSKLATFKKDLTRFAPVWALYLIALLLVLTESGYYSTYDRFARNFVAEMPMIFSIVNLIYAAVIAVMIYGDLYNTRMCYSLHTLPQRRETWLLSHLAAGFLFSLVPNALACGYLMLQLEDYWFLALYALLAMELQFVFFYGVATLSAFLTGNRFAMLLVYAGLNFVSLLAYATVEVIYLPMLTGVSTDIDLFTRFCPTYYLCEHFEFFTFEAKEVYYGAGYNDYNIFYEYTGLGTGWGYMAILAVLGALAMGLSFLLYKLRHLECAGDFIAFRKLKPAACLIITLCVALVFAVVGDMMGTGYILWLCVGVVVGYFGSLMLLERRVKVFRPKVFIWFGVLVAVLIASFWVVATDQFGIVGWTPEVKEVKSVTIANYNSNNYYYEDYYYGSRMSVTLTEDEEIADIIEAHEDILDRLEETKYSTHYVVIQYKLENGRTVKRSYSAPADGTNYEIISRYFYTPENILGYSDTTWEKFVDGIRYMYFDSGEVPEVLYEKLMNALKADCEKGFVNSNGKSDTKYYVEYQIIREDGNWDYRTVFVESGAVNTIAVLNSPEMVLGYSDWEEYLDSVSWITVDSTEVSKTGFTYESLLEAMKSDCEAGTLDLIYDSDDLYEIYIEGQTSDGRWLSRVIGIPKEAVNTMAWITEFYGADGAAG